MTLLDLIAQSLRTFNAYNPGETLSADEVQDAVSALNVLVDSWDAEGLMVYATTQDSFSLVAGQSPYTWGTSGTPDFNTARPIKLVKAFIRDTGNIDYPVEIIGEDRYEDIPDKTVQGIPYLLWYNPTYPLGTVYLYFVPSSDTYTLHLDSEKDLIDFSTLTAEINLPKEYLAALKWNLGIELCPSYDKQPTPFMILRSNETMQAVRRINAANKVEPVRLNLFTNQYVRGSILTGYDY